MMQTVDSLVKLYAASSTLSTNAEKDKETKRPLTCEASKATLSITLGCMLAIVDALARNGADSEPGDSVHAIAHTLEGTGGTGTEPFGVCTATLDGTSIEVVFEMQQV
eukprot:COSAG06_NODE_49724_length_323_cov_0.924107_1_plen_107_part_11